MLQVVGFERAVVRAEHLRIRLGDLAAFELEVRELKRAHAIGHLRQQVLPRICGSVEQRLFGEHEVECSVEGLGDHLLAVVVVDLHLRECLKVLQVLRYEHDEVALEANYEGIRGGHLAPPVRENAECEGGAAAEPLEGREEPLAGLHLKALVVVLAVHQRGGVEGYRRKRLSPEIALHGGSCWSERVGLVVEDQRDNAVLGVASLAPRFVDEYAELPCDDVSQNEKCRGTPPATW